MPFQGLFVFFWPSSKTLSTAIWLCDQNKVYENFCRKAHKKKKSHRNSLFFASWSWDTHYGVIWSNFGKLFLTKFWESREWTLLQFSYKTVGRKNILYIIHTITDFRLARHHKTSLTDDIIRALRTDTWSLGPMHSFIYASLQHKPIAPFISSSKQSVVEGHARESHTALCRVHGVAEGNLTSPSWPAFTRYSQSPSTKACIVFGYQREHPAFWVKGCL